MAASLLSFYGLSLEKKRIPNKRIPKRKRNLRLLHVTAQSSRGEEGGTINMVDASMGVLRERIMEVRMQERLQRYCKGGEGWCYTRSFDNKGKRDAMLRETLQIAGLAAQVIGITVLSGTFALLMVSLVLHMSQ